MKWITKKLGMIHDETGLFLASCNTPALLCQRHNAACDAYEARIAELEAERDARAEIGEGASHHE